METSGRYIQRLAGIDALRSFGCIAIVCWHVLANGRFQISGYFVERVIPSWDYLVFLFMIISGFGVCNGYLERIKNKQINIEDFYIRRYSKILPFFALLVILDVAIEHSLESIMEGFIDLTLVFGFLPNNQLSVIGVGWTLGIIFAFYIIFPFMVFLLSNKRRAWLSFLISITIQNLCQIYFMSDKFVPDGFVLRHSLLFCIPYFLVGGLIFYIKIGL